MIALAVFLPLLHIPSSFLRRNQKWAFGVMHSIALTLNFKLKTQDILSQEAESQNALQGTHMMAKLPKSVT